MRSSIWLWLGWLLLVASPTLAATPELVGEFGDPDRIQFVGNEAFDSKLIRAALRYDVEILLAGHPRASTNALLQLLQQRLEEGYLNSGFPDPKVTVRFDDQRSAIVASIVEGPRYRCADVEVMGTSTIPVARFVDRLLNPKIDPLSAQAPLKVLWLRGKPASFSEHFWQSKHDAFQKIFHSLGYYDVTFTVSARPLANRKANLVIQVTDEGPRATLGEIEIVGTKKNTPNEVIRYLELQPGMLLDADKKAQIKQKLTDSARFLQHEVEIISPPFGNEPSLLKITLLEYDEAPSLSQSFSAEEETMVRLAHWLNQLRQTDDDFEATIVRHSHDEDDAMRSSSVRAELRVAISPRKHTILLFVDLAAGNGDKLIELWIHLTPQTTTLDAPRQSLKFEARGLVQCVVATLSWSAKPPDAEGRMSAFNFGIGVKGNSDSSLPPVLVQMTVDPIATLREAHRQKNSLKITDESLFIDQPDIQLIIERSTGRLVKWDSTDAAGGTFHVTFEPGRYEKLLAEYQALTSQSRVIVPGDYPISNLLMFLANCVPDWPGDDPAHAETRISLARTLLKRGAFHAFDTLLIDFFSHTEDDFSLPPPPAPSKKVAQLGWTAFVLPVSRLIAPSPSWPVTLGREYVFARSKNAHFASQSIQALLTDEGTGPLMNLSAAYLFGMLNPQLQVEFARRGLSRLERQRFYLDCEPFLDPKYPLGKLLQAATQTLQELDDHEIETLVNQLPLQERDRDALIHALRLLPAHQNDPPLDAVRMAVDDAWEPLIEPHLRTMLKLLAN